MQQRKNKSRCTLENFFVVFHNPHIIMRLERVINTAEIINTDFKVVPCKPFTASSVNNVKQLSTKYDFVGVFVLLSAMMFLTLRL